MPKQLKIKILILFLPLALQAQYSEVGLTGGGTHFLGDVGNYTPVIPRGYYGGAFYRYNFDRRWSIQAGGHYGFLQAADRNSGLGKRKERNLSFQSEIWEADVRVNFNYLPFAPGTKLDHSPYLSAGFGVFWFDPHTRYQGDLIALQPLGTEGQGTSANEAPPYALASRYFLFGIGYKWSIGRLSTIALETTFRSTNTDYLDDVSGFYPDPEILANEAGPLTQALSDRSLSQLPKENQWRGNPANKDWYIFTGVQITVKFEEFYEKCTKFL